MLFRICTGSLCLAHATARLRASCPESEEEAAAAAAEEEAEEAEEEEIFCVVCPWSWVRAGAPNVARPEHPGVVQRCLAPCGYTHINIRTQVHRTKRGKMRPSTHALHRATWSHMHIYLYICMHTHTHTHTHTRTHTHSFSLSGWASSNAIKRRV